MSRPAAVDQRSRRRFWLGVIAGALAMVLIAVIATLTLLHRMSQPDPLARVAAKYQALYADCRAGGETVDSCTDQIGDACSADPFFVGDPNSISDISDTCLSFDDAR